MKNLNLIMAAFAFLALSCKNEVPVAPATPPVPVEKPKKNDVPNPTPVPENPTTRSGISAE